MQIKLTRSDGELVQRFNGLKTDRDVADILEVTYGYLCDVLYGARSHYKYKSFTIKKKSGKLRVISAPPYQIKILQLKLNYILSLVYRPKSPVHGFIKGRSTVTNAQWHVKKTYVLNIDLQDFFPSINFGRVRGALKSRPFFIPLPAATVLADLCCHERKLLQGAPTSPTISNIVCAKLDDDLWTFAQRHRCDYTRYCDDITLSTDRRYLPRALVQIESSHLSKPTLSEELVSAIEGNGFKINQDKVRLLFKSQHQEVTGLTVNDFPNVPRKFVRQVRAMIHAVDKFGLAQAQREFYEKYDRRQRNAGTRPEFEQILLGKLAYIQMVKGDTDPVYRRLRHWLHAVEPQMIEDVPDIPAPTDTVWTELYRKCASAVVQLHVRKENGDVSGGAAFVVADGVLATAAHCLDGVVYISPWFETEHVPVEAITIHQQAADGADLAIIRSERIRYTAPGKMEIRSQPAQPGEEIAAMGYPSIPLRQPSLNIMEGKVQGVAPTYRGTVQTISVSVEISGGMSGGPVLDRRGKLIGVAIEKTFERVAEDVPARAFNHVLPAKYLVDLLI